MIVTKNKSETIQLGELIAGHLNPNDIVALSGELGAGKTTLIQGIAKGLGIANYVTSPTFTLINEFKGAKDLYHVDLYRIDDISQVEDIALEEYFTKGGITVIEWADKAKELLPKGSIWVNIDIVSENERSIDIRGMVL